MKQMMTHSRQSIAAGMVTVSQEEYEQRAFTQWMDIRIKRSKEWDSMQESQRLGYLATSGRSRARSDVSAPFDTVSTTPDDS